MDGHRVPVRTCIICGSKAPKRELARVVLGPDGSARVDQTGKAPGRGAYVCGRSACRERVLTGGRLTQALRQPVDEEARKGLAARLTEEDASA